MSRLNPLYLGFLLLVLLIFISFKLSSAKSELAEVKEEYKESLRLCQTLSELKKSYTTKFESSLFKSTNITKKSNKSGVTLSSQSMDKKILDSLMSKILNGSYNIKELKIKKVNETKVSFYMEIKW